MADVIGDSVGSTTGVIVGTKSSSYKQDVSAKHVMPDGHSESSASGHQCSGLHVVLASVQSLPQ
jgi:hypothetical protein